MTNILATLFPGNDNVAKLQAQLDENETLRAELGTAQSKITELSGLTAVIVEKDGEIASLTAKVTESEKEVATLKADLAAAEKSAGKKTAEALASIGQPEPLADGSEAAATTTHLDTFNNLKGAEATAYFNKFQKEIAAEQIAAK